MSNKSHEKKLRRREKLKARSLAGSPTSRAKSGHQIFGTPEFIKQFGGVSAADLTDFTASQLGRTEVSLADIPEPTQTKFREEADRLLKAQGVQARFFKVADEEYSMMF